MKNSLLVFVNFFVVLNVFSLQLKEFGYNKYSQSGEDGIIEKIFQIIKPASKVCIEFGAWDGYRLSNTAKLWAHEGWKAILIESDARKYQELRKNIKNFNNCLAINAHVGNGSNDNLEFILEKHGVFFGSVDLLSIDIDGNDYYIFESLRYLRPRVIICEFNPTLPFGLKVVGEYNNYIGCSVGALIAVAERKGYRFIAMTDTNCFFVLSDEINLFKDFELRFEEIKIEKFVEYLVTSYAGEYKVIGKNQAFPYGLVKKYDRPIYGNFVELPDITVKK